MPTDGQRNSRANSLAPSPGHTLLVALAILLIGLALLKFSPLGTSERADKYAQDLFNSFLGDYVYPDTVRNESLVLLLTDEAIKKYQQGRWPADYSFHGRVLNALLVYKPATVFIDFYWLDAAKQGSSYLLRVLKRYRDADIPVYVAVNSVTQFYALWPELKELVIPVSAGIDLDPSDFVARSYAPYDAQLGIPTAAFNLARDQGVPMGELQAMPSMQIFWGTKPDPFNTAWMAPVADGQPHVTERLTHGFSALNQHLPYTPTLLVRDLLNPVPTVKESTWGDEAQAYQEARGLIAGRTVFYGGSISGVRDHVFTPLRDLLPGVFYHAMAFDNLKAWNGDYKADKPHSAGVASSLPLWLLDVAALLPVVVLGTYLFYFRGVGQSLAESIEENRTSLPCRRQERCAQKQCGISLYAKRVGLFTLGLAIDALFAAFPVLILGGWIVLCAWVEFEFFNVAASNWIEYAEVISLGFVVEKAKLIKRLKNQWDGTRQGP